MKQTFSSEPLIEINTLSGETVFSANVQTLDQESVMKTVKSVMNPKDCTINFVMNNGQPKNEGEMLSFEESPYNIIFTPKIMVLTASADGTAKLWKVDSQECFKTFQVYGYCVNSAIFSSDSKQVLTASDDSTAKLWNIESGECVNTFRHECAVTSVAFSS